MQSNMDLEDRVGFRRSPGISQNLLGQSKGICTLPSFLSPVPNVLFKTWVVIRGRLDVIPVLINTMTA